MSAEKLDHVTGTATTGHEWDGIRELNTPLPRWWLWLFYICIVWGIGYLFAYPAIPLVSSYTKGFLGYASRDNIETDMAALKTQRGAVVGQIEAASLADIEKNPQMLTVARAIGKAAFGTNCAPCHGQGGQGAATFPNLNDDQWIWGGTLDQIDQTIQHGIRNESDGFAPGSHAGVRQGWHYSEGETSPSLRPMSSRCRGRKPEGAFDLAQGQGDVRRELRRLPWRAGQG